ncbi:MAG TPA: multicopper oxidase domain-containing protein [Acidimicrobiales bacterium]
MALRLWSFVAPGRVGSEDRLRGRAPAEFAPYDSALRAALGSREHVMTLRATEKVIEVAHGVTQELWTFDDQVLGPTLRGKVGDNLHLTNEGKIGHSIDFHTSNVVWNDEMHHRSGEVARHQYEAKYAGIFMYHCGTAPSLLYPIVTQKVANVGKGALGVFQAGDVQSTGARY